MVRLEGAGTTLSVWLDGFDFVPKGPRRAQIRIIFRPPPPCGEGWGGGLLKLEVALRSYQIGRSPNRISQRERGNCALLPRQLSGGEFAVPLVHQRPVGGAGAK